MGKRRWPVERSNAWVLENKRLALRYDRLGFIIQSLLQAACIFLVAAQRLEQLNKELDTECLISGTTFNAAGPDCGDTIAIGAVPVRGRERAVEVFALQCPRLAVNTAISEFSSSRRSFMTQDDKSYRGITGNKKS